jgi:hypothetical protein
MCMAEPACKLFLADALCCQSYGIVLHAAPRLWLVCTADVFLPEPKCLTGAEGGTSWRKQTMPAGRAAHAACPCPHLWPQ